MPTQCFFCKKYEEKTCPVKSIEEGDFCAFRDAMSEEEVEATVEKDIEHITEIAQSLGIIPEGVTIEEYFAAVRRQNSDSSGQFC
jgi:hypothetical protein